MWKAPHPESAYNIGMRVEKVELRPGS